jgi:homoserine dehydrogenase
MSIPDLSSECATRETETFPEKVVVLKFGSSVLVSRADLLNAVHEIYRWYRDGSGVIVVVSAIGKATETLLEQSRELSESPEPWATAELLATGERTSAALLGLALDRAGVPARVVNPREIGFEVEGAALDGEPVAVDTELMRKLLRQFPVLVVPGFFGTDAAGRTQLLGRGGSDLTAVFLAVSLAARGRLLKDVAGVFESDPADTSKHPRRFTQLGYADALKVAGKLIQPKAVAYLQRHKAQCEIAALANRYHTLLHSGPTTLAAHVTPSIRSEPPDIVLLGCGTVGFGVYQRLLSSPLHFRVIGVLVRDRTKHETAGVPPALLHTTPESIKTLRPQLVIDALPGATPSRELIEYYLEQGIDVVSANKAVVADAGVRLTRIARETGAMFEYSAAVGGSAPMLEAVSKAAARGEIKSLVAVLNGTCNFVLDACTRGATLAHAVADAQRCGFAEADPSEDLSGRDAARKLQILASHAFGAEVALETVQSLDESVAQAARDSAPTGSRLRQIAFAARDVGRTSAGIRFEPVPAGSPFAALEREWNAITLTLMNGDVLTACGRGAGRWPTTESVMGDVYDALRAQSSRDAPFSSA